MRSWPVLGIASELGNNHIYTVEIGQKVWGKMRKLGDIYEELFDEKIEGAHRSINDVEATARIVNWYIEKGEI